VLLPALLLVLLRELLRALLRVLLIALLQALLRVLLLVLLLVLLADLALGRCRSTCLRLRDRPDDHLLASAIRCTFGSVLHAKATGVRIVPSNIIFEGTSIYSGCVNPSLTER